MSAPAPHAAPDARPAGVRARGVPPLWALCAGLFLLAALLVALAVGPDPDRRAARSPVGARRTCRCCTSTRR